MEQRPVLSAELLDNGLLSEDEILRRLQGRQPSGRRASPDVELTTRNEPSLRGDHELNPGLYDSEQKLRAAAVLVPIVLHPAGANVLLTRRTDHLNDHAGQIAFPGGRLEPGDEGPREAALRETREEIGLAARHIEIVSELDTYVTRTGFEVTPLVGLLRPPFDLKADPFEVAEIFEVPLGYFLREESREIHSREWRGEERHFFVYPYENYYIWGATAGMLNNLAEWLSDRRAQEPC